MILFTVVLLLVVAVDVSSVLARVRLDVCLNLQLQSHVKVKKHEPDTDQKRQGAPRVVSNVEQ